METNQKEKKGTIIRIIILACVIFLPIVILNFVNRETSSSIENNDSPVEFPRALEEPEPEFPDFFEGIFTPGTLEARYVEDFASPCTIHQILTIREDHSFTMTETTQYYNGETEKKVYRGNILNKYTESYNGIDHTWYTLEGESGNLVGCWSIESNGNAVPGKCTTYREVHICLNDNRSRGWHWKMSRKEDKVDNSQPSNTTSQPVSSGSSFLDKLAKIKQGMTEDDVISIMGNPNDRLDNYVPGFKNLFYRSGDIERVVQLQNGKVTDVYDPTKW